MLTCIFGENSSGKSRYAESLVAKSGYPRIYIATMIPYGESGAARVQKHIKQRENLGFSTVESPYLLSPAEEIPGDCVVLLEDLSNLLANRMFEGKGDGSSVLRDVKTLAGLSRELFVVSITGLSRAGYTGETAEYIDALTQLNAELAETADRVYEMQDGVPVLQKGEPL